MKTLSKSCKIYKHCSKNLTNNCIEKTMGISRVWNKREIKVAFISSSFPYILKIKHSNNLIKFESLNVSSKNN